MLFGAYITAVVCALQQLYVVALWSHHNVVALLVAPLLLLLLLLLLSPLGYVVIYPYLYKIWLLVSNCIVICSFAAGRYKPGVRPSGTY